MDGRAIKGGCQFSWHEEYKSPTKADHHVSKYDITGCFLKSESSIVCTSSSSCLAARPDGMFPI